VKKLLWTENEIEILKEFSSKKTAREIGAIVGRSKNAVNNKISLMKLPALVVPCNEASKYRVYNKKEPAMLVKPKPPKKQKDPLVARFKNHEAAAKTERRLAAPPSPTRIEWCKTCHSPVSNWVEHQERQGHGREV
jgi:hypothetical protein